MTPTRVLLADDHAILRSGLALLIGTQPDLSVVGEASNGAEAVTLAERHKPDLLVMDISMPEMNGLDATRLITKQRPQTKVLLLTMHENEEYFFRAVQAGAAGYVLKKAADTELLDAIRAVMKGQTYMRPSVVAAVCQDWIERAKTGDNELDREKYETLTAREREVLQHIAQGLTNQEVADKLVISVRTVETHRAHIMDKLDLHKRSDLVQYAQRKGMLLAEA